MILLPFFASGRKSHQEIIDSFLAELPKAHDDTNKVKLLANLSFRYDNVDPQAGLRYGLQCLQLANRLKWQRGVAMAHNSLGNNYVNIPDFENATKSFLAELEIHKANGYKSGIQTDYYLLATVLYYQSMYDSALVFATKALEIAGELKSKKVLANAYSLMGGINGSMGNLDIAEKFDLLALKIHQEAGNTDGIAMLQGSIANNAFARGDFSKALQYFFASLKTHEESGNRFAEAHTLTNIAEVYAARREYAKAEQYAFRAMKMSREIGDSASLSASYENLQLIYNDQGYYDKGLSYLFKDLELSQKLGLRDGIAGILGNIGATYAYMKRYRSAIVYGEEALKRSREIGDPRLVAVSLMQLGNAYLESVADTSSRPVPDTFVNSGEQQLQISYNTIPQSRSARLGISIRYLEQAATIIKSLGSIELIAQSHQHLAKAYELAGNSAAALAYYKSYQAAHDSIYNEEKATEIARNEMQYAFAKKADSLQIRSEADLKIREYKIRRQRQLIYLAIASSIVAILLIVVWLRARAARARAEQQATFSRQLLEIELKALRAQMNPHFIFNCLNSIQAYILKENKLDATDYLQKFSRLIRLILDNSQKTSNTIEDETEILTLYLDLEKLRLKNKFDYNISVADDIDPSFTEIPSMVIQPLVENSVWHGFSDIPYVGRLDIAFTRDGNQLRCVVEDNGIGKAKSAEAKRARNANHESKGTRLIEDRLKAWSLTNGLSYSLKVSDASGSPTGTRTEITILYPANA